MLIICIAGTVIFGALYFTLTFGALGWLTGSSSVELGNAVGAATGAGRDSLGAALMVCCSGTGQCLTTVARTASRRFWR